MHARGASRRVVDRIALRTVNDAVNRILCVVDGVHAPAASHDPEKYSQSQATSHKIGPAFPFAQSEAQLMYTCTS
jgi:hypothetical protein